MIAFRRLSEVATGDLIELMTHSLVRRQMPLATGPFGEAECRDFVAAKERLWDEHGYGPWAFFVDSAFAGWGGLQPEDGEADLGLVLHPRYWDLGRRLYDEIIERAFGEMGLSSLTVLLPPSRTRVRALARLGFVLEGALTVHGETFIRYRLRAPPGPEARGGETGKITVD